MCKPSHSLYLYVSLAEYQKKRNLTSIALLVQSYSKYDEKALNSLDQTVMPRVCSSHISVCNANFS